MKRLIPVLLLCLATTATAFCSQGEFIPKKYLAKTLKIASETKVPISLVYYFVDSESSWNEKARNVNYRKGVYHSVDSNLTQLNSISLPYLVKTYFYGFKEPFSIHNWEHVLTVGLRYLADLNRRFGSWEKAIVAYKAGPLCVSTGTPPTSVVKLAKGIVSKYEKADKMKGVGIDIFSKLADTVLVRAESPEQEIMEGTFMDGSFKFEFKPRQFKTFMGNKTYNLFWFGLLLMASLILTGIILACAVLNPEAPINKVLPNAVYSIPIVSVFLILLGFSFGIPSMLIYQACLTSKQIGDGTAKPLTEEDLDDDSDDQA